MKGPNDVVSLLMNFLQSQIVQNVRKSIFPDGSARQNRNCTVLEFWYTLVCNNHIYRICYNISTDGFVIKILLP
jgi:hypothetical protein